MPTRDSSHYCSLLLPQCPPTPAVVCATYAVYWYCPVCVLRRPL